MSPAAKRAQRARLAALPPDDGLCARPHGSPVAPEERQRTARAIMAGFDEAPAEIRDLFNYSWTASCGINVSASMIYYSPKQIAAALRKHRATQLLSGLGLGE